MISDLLLQVARPDPDLSRLAAAARFTEWSTELARARAHCMSPLLYWHLKQCSSGTVPTGVLACLASDFETNARRNLRLSAELHTFLDCLAAEGIPALSFKGPTLATLAYPNLAVRAFADLDLFVQPRDRTAAVAALTAAGCEPAGAHGAERLPGNIEATLITSRGDTIDLHWRASPRYFLPLDESGAWTRVRSVTVANRPCATLGPEDLFSYVVSHAARHCWSRLTWISDIARLIEREHLDWDRLMGNAFLQRSIRVAVLLAHDMLETAVPVCVIDPARADPVAADIAWRVQHSLFHRPVTADAPSGAWMHLRLAASAGDKFRYLFHRAFEPNQTDNDMRGRLPIPVRALYLTRPARMFTQALRISIGNRLRKTVSDKIV